MQQKSTREVLPGFAPLIRRARIAKRWTTARLAHEAGISPTTVSGIECEVRAPSLRVAALLARALSLKLRLDRAPDPAYFDAHCPDTNPQVST